MAAQRRSPLPRFLKYHFALFLDAMKLLIGILVTTVTSGCSTGSSVPIGTSQLFDLQLQPVRVPLSAQGAMALSMQRIRRAHRKRRAPLP